MKYKIGQKVKRLYRRGSEYGEEGEIVCLGIFGDGAWRYGFEPEDNEYGNQIDFYTEEEMEDENFVLEDEK